MPDVGGDRRAAGRDGPSPGNRPSPPSPRRGSCAPNTGVAKCRFPACGPGNRTGFPAAEGWYATIASPHLTADTKAAEFVKAYKGRFGVAPEDYSITAYDAALVIIDSAKRVAAGGKPVTRSAVRDAIQSTKIDTLQGEVAADGSWCASIPTRGSCTTWRRIARNWTTCPRSTSISKPRRSPDPRR